MDEATAARLDQRALSCAKQIAAIELDHLPGGTTQYTARIQVLIRDVLETAWFSPRVKVASTGDDKKLRWMFVAEWDARAQMYVTLDPIVPASSKDEFRSARAALLRSSLVTRMDRYCSPGAIFGIDVETIRAMAGLMAEAKSMLEGDDNHA